MAKLSFLWHLHQPQYRSADGHVHAPWVLLHSAGEYLTLARALERTGLQGQVLNLTPVLLEQLVAYRDGTARDPLLEALQTPARELDPEQHAELLRWAFPCSSVGIALAELLNSLGPGASILSTSAPRSPSSIVQNAPGTSIDKSRIFTPSKANMWSPRSINCNYK